MQNKRNISLNKELRKKVTLRTPQKQTQSNPTCSELVEPISNLSAQRAETFNIFGVFGHLVAVAIGCCLLYAGKWGFFKEFGVKIKKTLKKIKKNQNKGLTY